MENMSRKQVVGSACRIMGIYMIVTGLINTLIFIITLSVWLLDINSFFGLIFNYRSIISAYIIRILIGIMCFVAYNTKLRVKPSIFENLILVFIFEIPLINDVALIIFNLSLSGFVKDIIINNNIFKILVSAILYIIAGITIVIKYILPSKVTLNKQTIFISLKITAIYFVIFGMYDIITSDVLRYLTQPQFLILNFNKLFYFLAGLILLVINIIFKKKFNLISSGTAVAGLLSAISMFFRLISLIIKDLTTDKLIDRVLKPNNINYITLIALIIISIVLFLIYKPREKVPEITAIEV